MEGQSGSRDPANPKAKVGHERLPAKSLSFEATPSAVTFDPFTPGQVKRCTLTPLLHLHRSPSVKMHLAPSARACNLG